MSAKTPSKALRNADFDFLNGGQPRSSVSKTSKMSVKTPSQILRIADFDFLNGSHRRPSEAPTVRTRHSMFAPVPRAKRIAELLAEMPAIGFGEGDTASKKSLKPSNFQIQKKYLSTSKKQVHSSKTDYTVIRRALEFVENQVPAETPTQESTNSCEKNKEFKPAGKTNTRHSGIAPLSKAKRIIDLYAEMPPPGCVNTASKKCVKASSLHIQKNILSTSKKQLHNRKTDHLIARRALNFLGNHVEDVQLHPKSKPLTRMSALTAKSKFEKNKGGSGVSCKSYESASPKFENILEVTELSQDDIKLSDRRPSHRYDLRSYKNSMPNSIKTFDSIIPLDCTEYRNVNQSFDASICEESSPKPLTLEKSSIELDDIPQSNSDASDILCDMLLKADISTPNLSQQIQLIVAKVQENVEKVKKQMEFLDFISTEVANSRNILKICADNNKQILDMTSNLLNTLKDNRNGHFQSAQNKKGAVDRKSLVPLAAFNSHNVSSDSINKINSKRNSVVEKSELPESEVKQESVKRNDKENNQPPLLNNISRSNDLRKTLLLSTLGNTTKNINIPPKSPNTKNEIVLTKINDLNIIETDSMKMLSPMIKMSPKINRKIYSPKLSKSSQIYKSLRDSVKFLKTPLGKKNASSSLAFETPNTRSRNITSNNIKRQLECLYDDT